MLQYETSPVLKQIADAFVRVEASTKFPPGPGLAIWACESAWGSLVTGDFNYWGITASDDQIKEINGGRAKFCPTHEDIVPADLAGFRADERATAVYLKSLGNGRVRYAMKRWFASYASIDESLEAFTGFFIDSPDRYAEAWHTYLVEREAGVSNAADHFLEAVCAAGYATGDAAGTELAIEHQQNIVHAVEMARRQWNPPKEMEAA